jgi:hypothetical protein
MATLQILSLTRMELSSTFLDVVTIIQLLVIITANIWKAY